jgi:hypothetical protein
VEYLKSRPKPEKEQSGELSHRQFFGSREVRSQVRMLHARGHRVVAIAQFFKDAGVPGSLLSLKEGVTLALKTGAKKSSGAGRVDGKRSATGGTKPRPSAKPEPKPALSSDKGEVTGDVSVSPLLPASKAGSTAVGQLDESPTAKSHVPVDVTASGRSPEVKTSWDSRTVSDGRTRNRPGTLYEVPENLLNRDDLL